MKSFITDDLNDLTLDSQGNIAVADGLQAYEQVLKNVLKLQQYEYPYDLEKGINWLGNALGSNANLQLWESQLLDVVKNQSFVQRIKDWRYDVENNNLVFLLVVETDAGEITIKG